MCSIGISHFLHKKTGNHVFFNGFPVIFSVYERIRTSDPSLRSSPEFCLARYHRLLNIACFQAFWMVRIACSYHCYHLIPTSLMPSLLQPCCKARKFSRTSSVSISTIWVSVRYRKWPPILSPDRRCGTSRANGYPTPVRRYKALRSR